MNNHSSALARAKEAHRLMITHGKMAKGFKLDRTTTTGQYAWADKLTGRVYYLNGDGSYSHFKVVFTELTPTRGVGPECCTSMWAVGLEKFYTRSAAEHYLWLCQQVFA